MKAVRIYELTCREELVPEYVDRVEFEYTPRPTFVDRGSEGGAALHDHYESVRIQEFEERYVPKHWRGHNGLTEVGQSRTYRQYIVIQPDLEKLLIKPWKTKLREQTQVTSDLEHKIKLWWKLPWYKRVWLALSGTGYEV